MYQIICVSDGREHILMDMRDEEYILDSPKLTLQINGAGALTFKIYPSHPEIGSIRPLTSIIKVYKANGIDREWVFTGRVMSSVNDIYNTGTVKCEGIMAYLLDSIVYPYEFQGTPADYVRQLVESHNIQVDESKRVIIRTLDLADADSNNNIVRANKNYPTTFDELNDKVIKLLNAYISVEEVSGKIYFDCCQNITHYNKQAIRLGENIIDLKQTKSVNEIRTIIIGIGEEDEDGNRPSVTVENAQAIAKYGRIVGTVEFENISTAEQLTKKAKTYLDSILSEINTVEVKAVDLNMTDTGIEEICLGYAYVESQYNGLVHEKMLVRKIDMFLMQPDKNTFTLGAAKKSITSTISHDSAELDRKVKVIASSICPKINQAVDNATQLITGAKGGYVVLDCGENADQHPEQILVMDAPEKENAVNVIRINKNGIGFSTSGYNGVYRNAWTIDGNLVADFITTGTMYADRIQGGTLTLGGDSNRNGVLNIKDSSGETKIDINNNGIDVNNGNFSVDMDGNVNCKSITTFKIAGNAVNQFNQAVDDSEALQTARQAISAAQSAANVAQSAAEKAQSTANGLQITVQNINNTIIPDILNAIQSVSGRVAVLESR